MANYKVDFHTHSVASPDGALTKQDYEWMLQHNQLDYVVVSDHNRIDQALKIQTALGERIIVGEEITTSEGEIIGLYLKEVVPPGLTPYETVRRIHAQGGLVYIPHPFETVRQGLSHKTLDKIAEYVDIVEVHNGRAVFQKRSTQAIAWAAVHKKVGAAGSDAHGKAGWGKTYTILTKKPACATLVSSMQTAVYKTGFPGLRGLAYPKVNRLLKRRTT